MAGRDGSDFPIFSSSLPFQLSCSAGAGRPFLDIVALQHRWRERLDISLLDGEAHHDAGFFEASRPVRHTRGVDDVVDMLAGGLLDRQVMRDRNPNKRYPQSVCRGKHPVHQFRAELVKAVAGKAVAGILRVDGAADPDEAHQIGDRDRKIEDVLQRPAVDRKIELSSKAADGRTDVLDDGGALVGEKSMLVTSTNPNTSRNMSSAKSPHR